MANSTAWENSYDLRTLECVAANAVVALETTPRVWPISGNGVRRWNPGGHPLSLKREPRRWVNPEISDERTPELPKL